MRENPVRGFEVPREKNPRRPVATQERLLKIREVAASQKMRFRRGRTQVEVPSYLLDLFDIVTGTARRVSAVCSLRYRDLDLERRPTAPFGAIRWPGDTDKEGREWSAPISPEVREAVNRILAARPGVGSGFLFPSPADPEKAITRHLADKWLRDAEAAANLKPLQGSLWHAYRRKWATERKHMPDVDVAAAGGWKSTVALRQSYQHADEHTILQVVLGGGELREAR